MNPPRFQARRRQSCAPLALAFLALGIAPGLFAQEPARAPAAKAGATAKKAALEPRGSILFVGNSFMFGAGSPVRFFRPQSVTDLNGEGIGGVPALFKIFANQSGLDYAVSLETAGGKGLDFHVKEKAPVIARAWDHVVLLSYSTLDRERPGNPDLLIRYAKEAADLLHAQNPGVDIRLIATWSRADQTYPASGHWHGRPIEQMALDVRAAYDRAAAGSPHIRGVIPVGEAWNRAFKTGVADPNPYDGIAAGQVNLWTHDHYHASTYGYYLEALMIFGDVTGRDPRTLGKAERAAYELGMSQEQAIALQQVAFAELAATTRVGKKVFAPRAESREP